MIEDLDKTLKELLQPKLEDAIGSKNIAIQFERPDKNWETNLVKKPTINLFLYDIRENLQLRSNDRYLSRNGTTGTESYAPVRIDFTYLISVWTQPDPNALEDNVIEEHMLLGKVLNILLFYPTLPQEVLQGEIARLSQPPRAWIAQPEDTPKTWEFWGSNEWRLKASISYRVTLHVEPKPVEVNLVTQTEITLQLKQ